MTGINTFPAIWRLYNACRRAGVWTWLVMESDANGKETVTFSTVTKPTSLPEEKDRKVGRRRKKPKKVKRDRERREAWLERRRTVEGRSVAELPSLLQNLLPKHRREPVEPWLQAVPRRRRSGGDLWRSQFLPLLQTLPGKRNG